LTFYNNQCLNIFFFLLVSCISYNKISNIVDKKPNVKTSFVLCLWAIFAQLIYILYFGQLVTIMDVKPTCNKNFLRIVVFREPGGTFLAALPNLMWVELNFLVKEELDLFL